MESLWIIHICWFCVACLLATFLLSYKNKYRKKAQELEKWLATKEHLEWHINDILASLENEKQEKYRHIENMQKEHKQEIARALQIQEETLQQQYREKQMLLQELLQTEQEKQISLMTQRFYEMSEKILEEKNKQFQEKQAHTLQPLHDEILRFKTEIAAHTKANHENNIALHTEMKHLREASMQISKDANSLADAMRGDTKLQGQWGEMILERLLEKSGLQRDREYYTQVHVKNEAKEILRPDVVIHLPHNRFVVVDSKVSLQAYERFFNEEDSKEVHLQAHIESVKKHIKSLASKQYQDNIVGARLDFVILFMPIEGAYNAILQHDMQLFLESYNKGIILAAPTTLMVILRLIHHIWSNEAKDKNLTKILQECSKLVKKFDNFTESMDKIERALESAQNAYTKADSQLRGRGSMGSYIRNLDTYMSQITREDEASEDGNRNNPASIKVIQDSHAEESGRQEQVAL